MTDAFAPYETGLTRLLERLGSDHPRCAEALTLQSRLLENVAQARLHGDTEARRAERAQIVGVLNQLALEAVGVSFNELGGIEKNSKLPLFVRLLSGLVLILAVVIALFLWIPETPPIVQEFLVHYADGLTETFAVGDLVDISPYTQVLVEAVVDQAYVSCTWSAVKGTQLPAKGCATQYSPPLEGDQDALSVLVQPPFRKWQTFAGLHIKVASGDQ